MARGLLLALALAAALPAAAATVDRADLQLHGYAKALGELTLADPYPVGGKARLQADLSGGTSVVGFRALFDLDLDVTSLPGDQLGERAAEVSLIPVECRVDIRGGFLDLSVGKQYVFWGQTDWVNPTDLFTPWDYVHISSELEDYRIAPWAFRATAYARATSFDLVWVPWPVPHVMDLSPMAAAGFEIGDPQLPDRSIAHSDIGLRIATRFAGIDASVMGFYGLDKRPGMDMDVQIDTTTMPPPPPIITATPTHGMMGAVGGDLAWGAGPLLLKGELAYYWTGDLDGDDPVVRNPELAAATGLTLVPIHWLNFTVQGTVNRLSHYDPATEEIALSQLGMPDPAADPRTTWGIVERLALDIRDVVGISIVSTQGLPAKDLFVMGYVSWRAADGLTVLAGVVAFGGPEDSRFGQIRDQSRVFLELKYSF